MKTVKITFIFLLVVCVPGFASTVSVTLNSNTQTITLGNFGDKTVTQINLTSGSSSTTYKWSVDAAWQTTSGQTGTFNTTVNHIALIPISGYAGCGDGTVSVANGGGGTTRNGDGSASTESTFSYILVLHQPVPYISVTGTTTLNCTLNGSFINGVGGTWSTLPVNSSLSVVTNSPASATISVTNPQDGLQYSGTLSNNMTIAGSPNCKIASVGFKILPPAGTTGTGGSGGGGGGGEATYTCGWVTDDEDFTTYSCEEDHDQRISIYPNPVTHHFTIPFHASISKAIFYLNEPGGKVVGVRERPTGDIIWDTHDLPSGIYILRKINGNSETSARILIRNN